MQSVEIRTAPSKSSTPDTPIDERKPAAIDYDSDDDEHVAPVRTENVAQLMQQTTEAKDRIYLQVQKWEQETNKINKQKLETHYYIMAQIMSHQV